MEKRIVRRYIEDWYRREIPPLVERELKVENLPGKVTSIVGPRRSGKTYYFFQLMRRYRDYLYLDFEDSALIDVKYNEILDIISLFTEVTGRKPEIILLDEVQNLDKWESAVRTLLDRTNYRVFITGSSSKLLSREIATQLRGRSLTYILLPFSFREFLKARNFRLEEFLTESERSMIKSLLSEYLEFGGFPEVVLSDLKEKILREYLDTIFYRDFAERHGIRSFEVARFIFTFAMQNYSKEISVNKIVNSLSSKGVRMGKNTVYSYVEKLEDTLSIFFLRRWSERVRERESWPRKVYLCDNGLSRLFRVSPDYGKLMENIVFLELLRMTNKSPLIEIFYFRDYQGREVDFLVREGLKTRELIQVIYASSIDEVDRRELRGLAKAYELFESDKPRLLIITWDLEDEIRYKDIKVKLTPLWKWLIAK